MTVDDMLKTAVGTASLEVESRIAGALRATKREGINDLLAYMHENAFFTAPCSGGHHLSCEGGLAEHSWNVFTHIHDIAKALLSDEDYAAVKDSLTVVSLLHDLGKIGDHGKAMYIENVLKTGKISGTKPYKHNPDLIDIPHSVRSVVLARQFIDLSEDEEWAVMAHDGLYGEMKYVVQGKETPMFMLLHWADMWASRVTEMGGNDKDGDEE